jgi:RES domain-containing protein
MYRLTQKKYADTPFSLAGTKLYGGRWNSKRTEALYFAESESLCCFEVFIHVNNDPNIIDQYDLYRIDIANELIVTLEKQDLPPLWRSIPVNDNTQQIGGQFLNASNPEYAALQAPSIISPRDNNYVVNPNRLLMNTIFKNAEKLEFNFDPRIFK